MTSTITSTTDYETEQAEKLRDWVDGLRAAADWAETNLSAAPYSDLTVHLYHPDAETLARTVRKLTRGAPLGAVVKDIGDGDMNVRRSFGPHAIVAYANRDQVCEQRVVGTETVDEPDADSDEARRVAELEAQLATAKAAVPTKPVERDIVEWECAPILGLPKLATRDENLAGVEAAKDAIAHVLCGPGPLDESDPEPFMPTDPDGSPVDSCPAGGQHIAEHRDANSHGPGFGGQAGFYCQECSVWLGVAERVEP